MKFNFSDLKFYDIENNELEGRPAYEILGNIIYALTKDLALVDISKKIFKGEIIELSDSDIKHIKDSMDSPQSTLLAFMKKTIKDFFEKGGEK